MQILLPRGFCRSFGLSLAAKRSCVFLFLVLLAGVYPCGHADAGETLTRVQARRLLNCGVSDGRVGFSHRDAKGRWSGLDADFCQAVAAAVIGDAERVKFVPLLTAARFLALRSNEIDVLSRNTTWTIGREAGLGVHTLFHPYSSAAGSLQLRPPAYGGGLLSLSLFLGWTIDGDMPDRFDLIGVAVSEREFLPSCIGQDETRFLGIVCNPF